MDELQEIQALRERLTRAGYEYYVLDRPTMSDYDYDHQLRRLEELEDELYNRNPYSRTMLLWFVLPGMNPSPGSRVEAMIQGYARLKAQASTRKEVQLINRFLRDLGTLKLCLKDQG